jgi:hypothetical protein
LGRGALDGVGVEAARRVCVPAEAALVGLGSRGGSPATETRGSSSLGTGWRLATEPRWAYVYVLPKASRSLTKRPRRSVRPIFTMRPSWTATTGAPGLA